MDGQGWSWVVKGDYGWSRVVMDGQGYSRKCFKYGSIINKEDNYSSNMFHVCCTQSHRISHRHTAGTPQAWLKLAFCVISVFEVSFKAQMTFH